MGRGVEGGEVVPFLLKQQYPAAYAVVVMQIFMKFIENVFIDQIVFL